MVTKIKNNKISGDSVSTLINFFQNEKYKEAESLALNLSKKSPSEPISWKILGIIYLKSGRFNKALYAKTIYNLGTIIVQSILAICFYTKYHSLHTKMV